MSTLKTLNPKPYPLPPLQGFYGVYADLFADLARQEEEAYAGRQAEGKDKDKDSGSEAECPNLPRCVRACVRACARGRHLAQVCVCVCVRVCLRGGHLAQVRVCMHV